MPRQYPNSGASDFIGPKPEDTKPILYLSGTAGASDWDEPGFTKATGSIYRCFSYAYVGEGSPLLTPRHVAAMDWCMQKNHCRSFLDSGAHTFQNFRYKGQGVGRTAAKGADRVKFVDELMNKFLDNYCQWIRWAYERMKFDFVVTFDAEKRCPLIWEFTKRMQAAGTWPIPVYHGDHSLDWVRKYIDEGHKLIGVGIHKIGKPSDTGRRRYYESVISLCQKHNVLCHGFAVTGDIMFAMPWYSADSTTYLKAAAYGKILDIMPEKQRVALIHVSTRATVNAGSYGSIDGLPPTIQKFLRDKTEKLGFDFDRVRDDVNVRSAYNAKVLVDAIAAHTKNPLKWAPWLPIVGKGGHFD